jgi:hypothetical protein
MSRDNGTLSAFPYVNNGRKLTPLHRLKIDPLSRRVDHGHAGFSVGFS